VLLHVENPDPSGFSAHFFVGNSSFSLGAGEKREAKAKNRAQGKGRRVHPGRRRKRMEE
jgi:hypothetical protein